MRNFLKKILRIFYGSIFLPELLFNEIKYRFKKDKPRIGFANDYFEGNPKEIFLSLKDKVSCFWVTTQKKTLIDLKNKGIEAYYYWNPGVKIMRPSVWVISNANRIPVKKNTIWINTHHGIPFKGITSEQFRIELSRYDIHFIPGKIVYDNYKDEVGVDEKILEITGYSKIDSLIKGDFDREKILHSLGLDTEKKTVLYAPTWSQDFDDLNKKGLFPSWDKNQEKLLEEICQFMEERNLNFIIRLHRYADIWWSKRFDNLIKKFKNVIKMSSASHPDSIPYLFISDILISDYSSIANDFIVLDRPIIFLETDYELFEEYLVPPSYRAGYIVEDKQEFLAALIDSLDNPDKFSQKRREIARELHFKLDGRATERAVKIVLNNI